MFLQAQETLDEAVCRILENLTGMGGVYLEQMRVVSKPARNPGERAISVTYVALIDINKSQDALSWYYNASWFPPDALPNLAFEHQEKIMEAKRWLRYKSAQHPLLLELLPEMFTLRQLFALYNGLYDVEFDKRNFFLQVYF